MVSPKSTPIYCRLATFPEGRLELEPEPAVTSNNVDASLTALVQLSYVSQSELLFCTVKAGLECNNGGRRGRRKVAVQTCRCANSLLAAAGWPACEISCCAICSSHRSGAIASSLKSPSGKAKRERERERKRSRAFGQAFQFRCCCCPSRSERTISGRFDFLLLFDSATDPLFFECSDAHQNANQMRHRKSFFEHLGTLSHAVGRVPFFFFFFFTLFALFCSASAMCLKATRRRRSSRIVHYAA